MVHGAAQRGGGRAERSRLLPAGEDVPHALRGRASQRTGAAGRPAARLASKTQGLWPDL